MRSPFSAESVLIPLADRQPMFWLLLNDSSLKAFVVNKKRLGTPSQQLAISSRYCNGNALRSCSRLRIYRIVTIP